MASMLEKRNDALRANPNVFNYPTSSDINITTRGSDWYWAVTAIMIASTFIFVFLSFTVPRRNRVFHYITAAITLVAAIAYFTMASNLGYTPILVEFQRSNPHVRGAYREIFYVRYIDWFVTTPLLLLDILLTAGLPWPTILYTILLDEVMIVTGLVGALVHSSYKWGYFTFALVSLFFIAWNIVGVGRRHATVIGPEVRRTYNIVGGWTIFLWFLYPIAWGVSEGGNVISPDSEAVFYGILDILAKPVFGALLLWGHRRIDPAVLGLRILDYEDNVVRNEKHHRGLTGSGTHHNGEAAVTGAAAGTATGALASNSAHHHNDPHTTHPHTTEHGHHIDGTTNPNTVHTGPTTTMGTNHTHHTPITSSDGVTHPTTSAV